MKTTKKPMDTVPMNRTDRSESANFGSVLAYDGYSTIEEDDNDAYSGVPGEEDEPKELDFEGREEDPESAEESPIDPQGNKE